jgi:DSF synthase
MSSGGIMNTVSIGNDFSLENLSQIDVEIDPEYGVVWVYLNPSHRPCFNPTLIKEVRKIQLLLEINEGKLPYNGSLVPIQYFVVDSHTPGIFSLGGDLRLFRDYVMKKDKEGFLQHAKLCIDTIHSLITGCRLPITTISLVRGDAIGGGLETALSCQVFIAEDGVEMGLPEVLFNLFPGMGAYHLLTQRVPPKQAEKLMLSGRKYPSKELYEMGVIDKLVEPGQGRNAVYSYIKESNRYRNGYMAVKKVREQAHPVTYEDLMDVCNYWVDVAMNASEKDLKLMDDLVKAQEYVFSSAEKGIQQKNIA